ncbi:unnamed protein product [Lactuca virosa]|uniref:TF-B3 domain-containing protein n=1 Tax=Lactuca virosa TaxID=75947 RepID=A0AAU9LV77_9ASTR|nr:unnamed protein product [Lactuca virosa]
MAPPGPLIAPPLLPSFFKVVLDPSRPHLPLPPGFISKLLENKIPEDLLLQSVNGEYSWKLKIKNFGEVYCIADGWSNVLKDTQLGTGDILLFRLVHHSTFKLSIYSPDGCEKELPTKMQVEHDVVVDEEEKGGGGREGEDDDYVDNGGRRHDGGGEDDNGGGDIEENPFFMKIISKAHKFYLRLPAEFVRLAGMNEERMIRMKNVDGKEWKMSLKLERSRKAKRRPRGRPRRVEKMVTDKAPATEVPKEEERAATACDGGNGK